MTFLVSGPAAGDLRDIRDWIAENDPQRAVRYLEELEALFARLAARPLIGRPRDDVGPGVRSMVHRNHVVFYRPRGADVEIARVLHGRRDLGRVLI